jgi:hypothetical protein
VAIAVLDDTDKLIRLYKQGESSTLFDWWSVQQQATAAHIIADAGIMHTVQHIWESRIQHLMLDKLDPSNVWYRLVACFSESSLTINQLFFYPTFESIPSSERFYGVDARPLTIAKNLHRNMHALGKLGVFCLSLLSEDVPEELSHTKSWLSAYSDAIKELVSGLFGTDPNSIPEDVAKRLVHECTHVFGMELVSTPASRHTVTAEPTTLRFLDIIHHFLLNGVYHSVMHRNFAHFLHSTGLNPRRLILHDHESELKTEESLLSCLCFPESRILIPDNTVDLLGLVEQYFKEPRHLELFEKYRVRIATIDRTVADWNTNYTSEAKSVNFKWPFLGASSDLHPGFGM